jgi:RNA polymerase sigma-70 factor (ECF subfamily)
MQPGQDDSAEDAALARRIVAARDPEAEASLCRRLFPRLRAYGLRHLRDEAAAADLAQHVLIVLLESLRAGRVEDPDHLAAFLMGTCRNTVLDWRKTERRRSALLERFGPSFAIALDSEPPAIDREQLARCLDHLSPRARTIVALTYFVEREPNEIGRELAMSPGNVRVARHRALAHLHDCLTQQGDAA